MAEKIKYSFLPEDKCLTEQQLFDYIDGKLKGNDMHHVEKHILSCAFCNDAMEGFEKINNREKVAADSTKFNSGTKKGEGETRIIPLHSNRKYYAMAAGLVLIIAVTLFLKFSVTKDMESGKMADMVQKDSSEAISILPQEEAGAKLYDSISISSSISKNENGLVNPSASRSDVSPEYYRDFSGKGISESPKSIVETESQAQAGLDQLEGDGDDFVNVVDDITLAEKSVTDESGKKEDIAKKIEQKKSADIYDTKTKAPDRQENKLAKNNRDKIASGKERSSVDADANAPVENSNVTTVPVVTGATVNSTTAPSSAGNYDYTTPTSTGTSTTVFSAQEKISVSDTVSVGNTGLYSTKTNAKDVDLSYENGVKMLEAGQTAASLVFFDEVLKNPSHKYFEDAQWKKSQALLRLKKSAEAKLLLQEIVKKGGKYKAQAEVELKKL